MASRSALVVGGGIGGLAAAIALRQRGWRVRVRERAAEFGEVGAAVSLWPNALRALDALGLGDRVRAAGKVEVGSGGIRDRTGRWLARTDIDAIARRYGPIVLVHRSDLLDVLLGALPADALQAGTEVTGVRGDGEAAVVQHTGGQESADLVLGADGIHSTVRRHVWPAAPAPRYAGYTAWRLLVPPLPDRLLAEGGESWGRGERFGLAQLPDGRIYCYATATTPAGATAPGGELGELRRRFGDWHDPIPALLAAAEETAVLRHDVYDLPPLPALATARVALLGDAAHAMTPDLGQGACQALEDVVTLGCLLADGPVPEALARYNRQRLRRTQQIVRRSRRVGAVGQWAWPPATTLRDAAVRMLPESLLLRSLAPALAWQPPQPASGQRDKDS